MIYFNEYLDLEPIYTRPRDTDKYSIHIQKVEKPSEIRCALNPEIHGQQKQSTIILRDNEKKEVVMSDSWMEQNTNIDFVRKASGDILIAGLGIGMIVLALQKKPDVKSITVVEKDNRLATFILSYIGPFLDRLKVKIVVSDIHKFHTERYYDYIYCDIWNNISNLNLREMDKLTEKFKDNSDNISHWRYDDTVELEKEDIQLDGLLDVLKEIDKLSEVS